MPPNRSVLLEFDPKFNPSPKKEIRGGLSAAVAIGDTLWLANDETISLERLRYQGKTNEETHLYGGHTQFALQDFLRLPNPRP